MEQEIVYSERKPFMTKKNRYLFLLAGFFLAVGIAFAAGGAADMNGERITHTDCLVTAKPMTAKSKDTAKERYHYHIDSSCGMFLSSKDLYDSINIDQTYDLVTTAGNWAHKPTLIAASETN